MENIDNKLGSYISRIPAKSLKTECPPEEVLSDFIEGNLKGRAHRNVTQHLSQCEGCYEQMVDVIAVEEILGDEIQVKSEVDLITHESPYWSVIHTIQKAVDYLISLKPSKRFAIAAPIALAVLAVAIRFGMPYSPPGFSDMMAHFTGSDQTAQQRFIPPEPLLEKHFIGFYKGLSLERAVFRIGILSCRLKVALETRNGEAAQIQLTNLISLVNSIKPVSHLALELEEYSDQVKRGRFPANLFSTQQKLESNLDDTDLHFFLKFGQWIQAGEIAAANQVGSYFDSQAIDYFHRKAVEVQIPQGVISGLEQMHSIIKQGAPDSFRFKMLEKTAQEIILILI